MRPKQALFEDLLPDSFSFGAKRIVVSFWAGLSSLFLYYAGTTVVFLGLVSAVFFVLPLFCAGYSWGKSGYKVACGVFIGILVLIEPWAACLPLGLMSAGYCLLMLTFRCKKVEGMLYYFPIGRCFSVVMALVIILLLAGETQFFDPLREGANTLKEPVLESLRQIIPTESSVQLDQAEKIVAWLFEYLWGVCLSLWMGVLFMNASLAVSILNKRQECLRPSLQVLSMNLPQWTGVLTLFMAAGMLLEPDSRFIKNAFVILSFGYMVQGLGVIHTLVKSYCQPGGKKIKNILGFFYVCVVLFPWILGGVACLGFLDQGIKLKQRIKYKWM